VVVAAGLGIGNDVGHELTYREAILLLPPWEAGDGPATLQESL
jgi:hypothetical protein